MEYLVNVRYNAIWNHLLVLLPVFAVSTTIAFISTERSVERE